LNVSRKLVGYAGTKDRRAVTTQYYTVKGATRDDAARISLNGVTVEVVGYVREPFVLGSLLSNTFTITVRNLNGDENLTLPNSIPNYFDEQRFSAHNAAIGEALIRRDHLAAAKILLEHDRQHSETIKEHLDSSPHDGLGAMMCLPRQTIKMYLHAYQSLLWNRALAKYVETKAKDVVRISYSAGEFVFPKNESVPQVQIPLPGFGVEYENDEIRKIVEEVLIAAKITPRDFVLKQLPNLSLEGAPRPALMTVTDYTASSFSDDEVFPGKKKVTLRFTLGKGSYATMLARTVFTDC
jgi:tRNA pseudouridine13 synthase